MFKCDWAEIPAESWKIDLREHGAVRGELSWAEWVRACRALALPSRTIKNTLHGADAVLGPVCSNPKPVRDDGAEPIALGGIEKAHFLQLAIKTRELAKWMFSSLSAVIEIVY